MYRHKTNRLRSDVSLSWRALCRLTTRSLLEFHGRISSLFGNHRSRWTQTVSTQMCIYTINNTHFAICYSFSCSAAKWEKRFFQRQPSKVVHTCLSEHAHMYAVVVAWLDYQPSNPLWCPLWCALWNTLTLWLLTMLQVTCILVVPFTGWCVKQSQMYNLGCT